MRTLTTKYFLTATFLFVLAVGGKGQHLNGQVLDQDKTPVISAYVLHQDGETHAHTNEIGEFVINNVAVGDTLSISSIGFKTSQYVITDLSKIVSITLRNQAYRIDEVVIRQDVSATNQVARIDLEKNPVSSSQEILRVVPGLFVGQHAGGGKAEQIFLRGFDIDHGTDVNITVEGVPANMVSHAHGQGYADLHFIIPEAIRTVDYGKGPYDADQGNFSTAGHVDFQLKNRLPDNIFSLELGDFRTSRLLGMFKIIDNSKNSLYVASEFRQSNGPFESSQNFSRLNVLTRYTAQFEDKSQLGVTFSHFSSEWDASGQIPISLVEDGTITRWGALDDTEGGNTGRTNFQLSYNKSLDENTFFKNNLYFSRYDFELWSNFTFFLRDTINGDQIVQREERDLFGSTHELNRSFDIFGNEAFLRAGVGVRADLVRDVELSDTRNRQIVEEVRQLGDVNEVNTFGFAGLEMNLGNFTINPSLRLDNFSFKYYDKLATAYEQQTKQSGLLSPKLNVLYNVGRNAQLFAKMGYGFHTNDSRVVLERSGEIIPQALGFDIGGIFKPTSRILINTALWYLFLEQEFVYVGDEGVVEPSGETERMGIDFSFRYQILDWLYFDTDWTFTEAMALEEENGSDYIPLAPLVTGTGGLSMNHKGLSSGLRFRYLGDRPANEDNSIVAKGYFVADFNVSYDWKNYTFGVVVENILDTEWEEAQFATESRFTPTGRPQEEIHFTPGTPRFIRGRLIYKF